MVLLVLVLALVVELLAPPRRCEVCRTCFDCWVSTPEPQRPLPPRRLSPEASATGGYGPSESIADTGMFRRFVAEEAQLEQSAPARGWVWVVAGVVIVVIAALMVWLLVR